jgi:hypothetical protein
MYFIKDTVSRGAPRRVATHSAGPSGSDVTVRGAQLPVATDFVEYEVGKLLDKTWGHHHIHYLIKWTGFLMEDYCWEPESNLKNSKRVLDAFNNKHEIVSQRPPS